MNIKILLPALASLFLLNAHGKIPTQQTTQLTIAKFENDKSIINQISKPEQRVIAYYDGNHQEKAEPIQGGYYRLLLGRTAKGQAVIQDFYQDNGARLISPVIIPHDTKLKLTDPFKIGLNGKIAFYNHDGCPQLMRRYKNGRIIEEWEYDRQGRLLMYSLNHETKIIILLYSGNGRFLYHYTGRKSGRGHIAFYRPDGSLIYTIRFSRKDGKMKMLDANGKTASQKLQDEGSRLVKLRMNESAVSKK